MLEDRLFSGGDKGRVWQKHCGFLDLTVKEFMEIQEELLRQQIEQVSASTLGKIIMKNQKLAAVADFRQTVPLTSYVS